jgi:Tol biopolymer transport system component
MLLYWLAIMAFFAQGPATGPSAPTVSVQKNEVWVQRQLTHDSVPKRSPVVSPSGNEVAYAVDKKTRNELQEEEEIVLVNMNGEIIWRSVPEDYISTSSEELGWIYDGRIGILGCGHANCVYWILDAGSGKTIQIMRGGFDFIWSHNRKFVARRAVGYGEAPAGEPLPEQDAVLLNEDHVYVYPPTTSASGYDRTRSHDLGRGKWPTFVWSPNDTWVAFTDAVGPEDDSYVVLVSPSGEILRETVPVDIDFDATINWQDDTHLELHTGGKTFKFAINGKQLSETKPVR